MENDNKTLIIVFLTDFEEIELMQKILLEETLKDSETFSFENFTDYLNVGEEIHFLPKKKAQKFHSPSLNNSFIKKDILKAPLSKRWVSRHR